MSFFKVTYKYSACISISTQDITLLCDPWFSDVAYYGTWHRYPRHDLTRNFIGEFDSIFISHIHPDHYCPHTLNKLFSIYGPKTIYIADWHESKNYLLYKLRADGFAEHICVLDELQIGTTLLKTFPQHTGSISDIDSSLLVVDIDSRSSVLNLNDCPFLHSYSNQINSYLIENSVKVELLCTGYTGAGPYPQTYFSPYTDSEILLEESKNKKNSFFARYSNCISSIPSSYRLPFAGKYILSGNLSILNKYRGLADAIEIRNVDDKAVILDDSGQAFFDIHTHDASSERYHTYNLPTASVQVEPYYWQSAVNFEPSSSLLKRLLTKSVLNAHPKSEASLDLHWSIYIYPSTINFDEVLRDCNLVSDFLMSFNCNSNSSPFDLNSTPAIHCSMYIDAKALFAVLTGICHWNNYEVGSVFSVRRTPNVYDRSMYNYLNYCNLL